MNIRVPVRMLQTYKECFFDETYHKGFPVEIRNRIPKTVVDIGANVGYFSLFALNKYPGVRVLSFEPMPNNFKLQSEYRLHFPEADWILHNFAVSGTEGSIRLNYDPSDSFTTDASIFNASGHVEQVEVKCISLEKVMNENGLKQIDFLKLDCEGSEYGILYLAPPGVLEKISVMAVETHAGTQPDENLPSLNRFLQKQGYSTNVMGSKIYAWK